MLWLWSHDYLSPKSVFDTIKMLMNRIFWTSDGSGYDPSSTDLTDFSDIY
jgi:hypothetical protein